MSQRLRLTNSVLAAYCAAKRLSVEPGTLRIFGIRGAIPVTSDTVELRPRVLDSWDDTIVLWGTRWAMFRGTVDPGRPYTVEPLHPDGAAHLEPGQYRYKLGTHKGLPALVQGERVTVRRDRDRDGRAEPGEPVSSGFIGLNIHRGGSIYRQVGKWSAGCQVIPSEYWPTFFAHIEESRQREFEYTLAEASALREFA